MRGTLGKGLNPVLDKVVQGLGFLPGTARSAMSSVYGQSKTLKQGIAFYSRHRRKPRVLYIVRRYPQQSQTYISSELRELWSAYNIRIATVAEAPDTDADARAYTVAPDASSLIKIARDFDPDFIHSHWMTAATLVGEVASATNTPFTIRSHSFDSIYFGDAPNHICSAMEYLNSDLCRGVLGFPFVFRLLVDAGLNPEKFYRAPPVFDFWRFYDRRTNGIGVMNTGAAIKKKAMPEFIELATRVKDRPFHLYPVGGITPELRELNMQRGSPVQIHEMLPHQEMPSAFKGQQWLVYTASKETRNIGWPLSIREAMASGVGVCLPRVRPDIVDYAEGAGFVYDSIGELTDLLRGDVPRQRREMGFEIAQRDGIHRARSILTELWN